MPTSAKDEALLKEIREAFDYYVSYWRPFHEEGNQDMRYISSDGPWTDKERKEREDAQRPCISLDELNQYVNQVINDVRMNKRSIKIDPKGYGANEQTAEARQSLIRGIESESNAQTAYTTAFEGAVQRGYGVARVITEYASDKGFNQVIRIKRIPNPDTVLFDPDAKEYDCSDGMGAFVVDTLKQEVFKRKYPNAQRKSFDSEDIKLAPNWVKSDSIIVAEYWKVKVKTRTLLLLDEQGTTGYLDEFEGASVETVDGKEYLVDGDQKIPIVNSRKCEERSLIQYITNGLEILETNPQDPRAKYIPLIPCFGREKYIDDGGGTKRVLESLIRVARDPYKMYCYMRSQEAEEAAMTPRAPAVAYEGQLEGHEDEWATAHTVPRAYLLVKPLLDATGIAVLPLPSRPQFQPNFQSYELACESMKRAIQSACGMYNTSTGKHDTNAKSGVAIKALDSQSSQGNFHFVDNYDRFMTHVGRVVDERIPIYYDTKREVGMRKPDDTHKIVRINDPEFQEDNETKLYDLKTGEHDVTVSTGPSYQSQREEAAQFVDMIVSNLGALPIDPQMKTKLLALSIKLKTLGPIGDEMVSVLEPEQDQPIPPQVQQMMAQAKQQIMALNAYAQKLEGEKKQLEQEKQAKILDNEYRLAADRLKAETSITIAEINTKAQEIQTRMQFEQDMWKTIHGSSHEQAMQATDQQHQAEMQQQQQAAAAQQQQQAQQAQQEQQQQEPPPDAQQ